MVTGQAGLQQDTLSWAQGQQVVTLYETTQTLHGGYKTALGLHSPAKPFHPQHPLPSLPTWALLPWPLESPGGHSRMGSHSPG